MDYAQRICSLVHSFARTAGIKVRTPFAESFVTLCWKPFAQRSRVRVAEGIIKDQVNVKSIEYR